MRKIREAYAQHKDREEVYQAYSDRLSRGGFYHVWDGSRWKEIMPEVYSEENKKWHANKTRFQCGENHNSSKLTDEEVLNIRHRYVNETAESIWQDYKDKYTLGSFKQILGGTKYSHLPIYKKARKSGFCSYKDYFITTMAQRLVRVLPISFQKHLYKKHLRRKDNLKNG